MSTHNSKDSIERFSMGRMQESELAGFEKHLLRCEECQAAVRSMDVFLDAFRGAAEDLHQQERPVPGSPVPAVFKGNYALVQAPLPNADLENIGVLLVDAAADRLYSRFRRDFEEFAGDNADRLQQLPDEISEMAKELGAQKSLEWMESSLSGTVSISTRKNVLIEDRAKTVDRLYAKHVHPTVLRFRTHLPRYSLEAAAGKFGKQMAVEPEGWVEVRTMMPLTDDMFVTHVKGHSMEPTIPDASLCAFRSKVDGSWHGKVLLIEQYGESGGSRYTVKLCQLSKHSDPTRQGDEAWLHQRVTLQSINPNYESWDVASAAKIRPLGEFLFVV
jgi:hypothetical protein